MRKDVEVVRSTIAHVEQLDALGIRRLHLIDYPSPHLGFTRPLASAHPMHALFLPRRARKQLLRPHADHLTVVGPKQQRGM